MDEMGHQEWADSTEKVCFVPAHHSEDLVYYPLSRTGKRITILACVAADGSFLKPAVVIPRKTYDEDLLLFGITTERVEFYSQENDYISMPIFEDWFRTVFIPELEKYRKAYSYTGPAFLMLDNCSAHTTQNCDDFYSVHGVLPIILPPHSIPPIKPKFWICRFLVLPSG
jgi:hypothetical protein